MKAGNGEFSLISMDGNYIYCFYGCSNFKYFCDLHDKNFKVIREQEITLEEYLKKLKYFMYLKTKERNEYGKRSDKNK